MNSSAAPPLPALAFRPDIEGLRGIAVLLVVACHSGISWCSGGFVGVDVFFVLSGYLITGLLAAEQSATSRIDFLGFFARRARRLLPAATLVLVCTLIAAACVYAPQQLAATARAAAAASLYVSNLYFDNSAADYFAPQVEGNPFLHTWSLGVEEQFYLLWPLLMLLARRRRAGGRRSVWILGSVAVLSFACSVYATRHAPTFAFYELPARAWEFACGGLLALLPVARQPLSGVGRAVCGVAGFVAILATSALVKGGGDFPGWIALLPVAGTLAVLRAGAGAPGRGIGALLGAAPLQFLGARSYSWYLWHWPAVVIAAAIVPGIGVPAKLLVALAALLAAMLTYRALERPVRASRYLRARSGLSLLLAAVATLAAVGAAVVLLSLAREQILNRNLESLAAAETDVGDLSLKDCVSQGNSTEVLSCEFGESAAQQTAVLFGDSHAIQWFNPLRTATHLEAWRLVTVLKSGCSASAISPHPPSAGTEACNAWRERAIGKIIALHPSVVLMASYTGVTMRGFRAELPITGEALRSGTRRTLERLVGFGARIVVVRDSPLPPFDVPACVVRQAIRDGSAEGGCDFDAATALNETAFDAERAAARGLANVRFLDLSDLICLGSSCPAVQRGILVYRDDNHLTGRFAESLAPALRSRLFGMLRQTP